MKIKKNKSNIHPQDTFRIYRTEEVSLIDRSILSGRYEIVRLLGSGAFGSVYLARHISLDVFRAVKCIDLSRDLHATARREADILKNLRHPMIPIIYDVEQEEDTVYIIEEFIDGESVANLLSKSKFNIKRTVNITLQLCEVLSYLHGNNTYHLDIKPENIIINKGLIKLVDYGSAIADEDNPKVRMGTVGYASPEMYGREKINSGSDVYSIGVLMLFMLTGRRDCGAIAKIRHRGMREIIESCISHFGNERIISVLELKKKLEKIKKNNSVEDVSLRIHVGGIVGHCGSTHVSLAVGKIMEKRGFKTIVCERNESGDFFGLIHYNNFAFDSGVFSIENTKIVPEYHGYVNLDFLEEYDRIVYDFGVVTEENLEEFLSGDQVYLVSGTQPYELNKLKEFHNSFLNPRKKDLNYKVLFNFSDANLYRKMIRRYGISNPVRVPYEPDVFKCKKDWLA